MQNIVLCGMMGAGKSAVGARLATMSGRTLVDTDAVIVERYGEIKKIFEEYGEGYFRDLESNVVAELAQREGVIISTGGGVVLREENANNLKKGGKIFFLKAELQTLVNRAQGDTSRPLLQGNLEEKMRTLLAQRTPIYEGVADKIIVTDNKTLTSIATEILQSIEE